MSTLLTGTAGASLGSMAAGTFGWTAATWSKIGWIAGVAVGTYLFSPDGPDVVQEGPRLDDLKVTTSTYGMDIPIVYGSYRIAGNIIWALPLQETRHEERQEEGKGGGSSSSTNIWYTYDATFAIALCEGEISSIKKIWFGSKLVYDNGSSNYLNNITIYKGTSTQNIDWRIQSDKADAPAYRSIAYIVFNDIPLEDYGNIIPNVSCEIVSQINILSEICSDLSLYSGLLSEDLNYSSATNTIVGYVVSKNISARAAIEPLLSAYNYMLIENDYKMELRIQQREVDKIILEKDLGANTDQLIEYNISQELDLIKSLTIKYANASSDYQTSVQSVRRIDTNAENEIIIELPIALTDNEAKQLAEKNLYMNWLMRKKYSFSLPSTYNDLIVGNVVELNYSGYKIEVRLVSITITDNAIFKCNAITNDYSMYESSSQGSETGSNGAVLKTGPMYTGTITSITDLTHIIDINRNEFDSHFDLLEIEFTSGNNDGELALILEFSNGEFFIDNSTLTNNVVVGDTYKIYENSFLSVVDTHTLDNSLINSEILYSAATGANDYWNGCIVYSKSQQVDDFSAKLTLLQYSLIAKVLNILSDGKTTVWDTVNFITINPYHGEPLEYSKESLLNGNNYCLVGNEILQFSSITDNLDGTFTLYDLLRGRRGTESYVSTHIANEEFILLNGQSIGYINNQVGSNNYYTASSIGLPETELSDQFQVLYTGKNLKPFSPSYFKGSRSGNNINLTWMRRSRYISGYMKTLPISESVEKYTLEVYNSSDVLIETINNISSESYTYISSSETRFKVYQVSNIVLEGYPSEYLIINAA